MGFEDVSNNCCVNADGFEFVADSAETPFNLILLHFGSVFALVTTTNCSAVVLFHVVGWYSWVGRESYDALMICFHDR